MRMSEDPFDIRRIVPSACNEVLSKPKRFREREKDIKPRVSKPYDSDAYLLSV